MKNNIANDRNPLLRFCRFAQEDKNDEIDRFICLPFLRKVVRGDDEKIGQPIPNHKPVRRKFKNIVFSWRKEPESSDASESHAPLRAFDQNHSP